MLLEIEVLIIWLISWFTMDNKYAVLSILKIIFWSNPHVLPLSFCWGIKYFLSHPNFILKLFLRQYKNLETCLQSIFNGVLINLFL